MGVSQVERGHLLLQLEQDGQRRAAAGVQQRAQDSPPRQAEHVAARQRGRDLNTPLLRLTEQREIIHRPTTQHWS